MGSLSSAAIRRRLQRSTLTINGHLPGSHQLDCQVPISIKRAYTIRFSEPGLGFCKFPLEFFVISRSTTMSAPMQDSLAHLGQVGSAGLVVPQRSFWFILDAEEAGTTFINSCQTWVCSLAWLIIIIEDWGSRFIAKYRRWSGIKVATLLAHLDSIHNRLELHWVCVGTS